MLENNSKDISDSLRVFTIVSFIYYASWSENIMCKGAWCLCHFILKRTIYGNNDSDH